MGREDCQDGWQNMIGHRFNDVSILDVGAGLGLSRRRLGNNSITLQDIGIDLPVDTVLPVGQIESNSFDVVTAFDVIEHVVDDIEFLSQLCRISRHAVFITTPNLLISRAGNGCHCREYSPIEFLKLFESLRTDFWVGDGRGLTARWIGQSLFSVHKEPHQAVMIWNDDAN